LLCTESVLLRACRGGAAHVLHNAVLASPRLPSWPQWLPAGRLGGGGLGGGGLGGGRRGSFPTRGGGRSARGRTVDRDREPVGAPMADVHLDGAERRQAWTVA